MKNTPCIAPKSIDLRETWNQKIQMAMVLALPMKFFSSKKSNKLPSPGPLPWYSNIAGKQLPDAKAHWDDHISENLNVHEKILLSEQLFSYIWEHHGADEAMKQIASQQEQLDLANSHFEMGCRLWSLESYEQSLLELEKSRRIQVAVGSFCRQEMEVQLHYAHGVVYLGLKQYEEAISEFRQAWRCGALTLGTSHTLTRSSQHRLESVFFKQRYKAMEIKHEVNIVQRAIDCEKEGDFHRLAEEWDLAIEEFRAAIIEYQRHQDQPRVPPATLEQASIRCKIASVYEAQGNRRMAEVEWANALCLYESSLGSTHPKTIKTMKKFIRNHSFPGVNGLCATTV